MRVTRRGCEVATRRFWWIVDSRAGIDFGRLSRERWWDAVGIRVAGEPRRARLAPCGFGAFSSRDASP